MTSTLSRSAIFFGKVVTSEIKQALKVSFDRNIMDKRLTMYFRKKTEVYAFDPTKQCCEGDYVIIREIPEVPCEGKIIQYSVEKLVYKGGYFVDPVSGRRNAGTEYIDDINKTTELFGFKRPYQKPVS